MDFNLVLVVVVTTLALVEGTPSSTCCAGRNIADVPETDLTQREGVSVTMSSLYPKLGGYIFVGSNIIDGMYGPEGTTNEKTSLAHTMNEMNPWMQIDLGQRRCIKAVKIWNRATNENTLKKFKDALITVSENGYRSNDPANTCNESEGEQPAVKIFECADVMCGRFVRIAARPVHMTALNLWEVEVHGW